MKSRLRDPKRNSLIFVLWFLGWLSGTAVFCVPAAALDPTRRISQYGHTAWRTQDGFFNGTPSAITQTTDGYLWIGTSAGLLRFDGSRFVPWTPPSAQRLFSNDIISLLGASDGSLWIGTASGLARWKDGKLTVYNNAHGHINNIVEDKQGSIWIARSRLHAEVGPLCKADESTLRCYGEADGVGVPVATALAADTEGNFWIGGPTAITRWNPHSYSTITLDGLKAALGLSGVESIAATADGSVLVGMSRNGPGLGLQRLVQGQLMPFEAPPLDGSDVRVSYLRTDREHTLWIGTLDNGIYHVGKDRAEHFSSAQGLSGDSIARIYQDHEGNIWVTTSKGIDEFHDLNIATYSTAEGINADLVASVVAARDGTVYTGNHVLTLIRNDHISSIGPAQGLPGLEVTSLLQDHAGRLWVGVDNKLAIYENHKFFLINKRDSSQIGIVVSMTEDTDGNIWAVTTGNPQKLVRIRDRKVVEEFSWPQDPRTVASDREKGIWIGLGNGELARYRERQLQTFPNPSALTKSPIGQLMVTTDNSVLGVSSSGLVGLRGGKVQNLNSHNGLPCDNLDGLIMDSAGSLWLDAECGLLEVSKPELQKWWDNPGAALQVKALDGFDGFQFGSSPFRPHTARDPDGKLWFVNGEIAQVIDPLHLIRNTIPPPVRIEGVIADRKSYPTGGDLELPARTRDLQIDYTALSLVVPQKVRFRYRLDGRDNGWHDSGNRRQAFYTDLGPGSYRFRVIASNNDGVWNDSGASLNFRILPAFYQAAWFRLLCASLALGTLWLLYLLRIRQATAHIQERLGARLEERERIARELHDTLLQGFQGLVLRFQAVMKRIPEAEPAHQMMEKALECADQVLIEGRDRVRDLRGESEATSDLGEDLARYGKEQGEHHSALFSLAVLGAEQSVISEVRHEAYRIGREALANAFKHARASTIEVEVTYALNYVSLKIRDDGIGIDQEILTSGSNGHWGLSGMRERAQKIGGRLNIWSHAGLGTEVDLTIPAKVAFPQSGDDSVWQRMKRAVGY